MLKKTFLIFGCLFFITTLLSFTEKKHRALRTIVIDAGHGIMPDGGYNGAKGSYSYEDDICLAVAQKLVAQIAEELPDVKIVQTRPTRYITTLNERANIAKRNRG